MLSDDAILRGKDRKSEQQIRDHSTWFKIQSYFNKLNNVLNEAVGCFMTLYLVREGRDYFS